MTIRQWRKAQNLTAAELARRLGVHPSLLSRWERGINIPEGANIAKLLIETKGEVSVADITKKRRAA